MNLIQQTISTVEIADMLETAHRNVIRKLEGQETKKGHIKGIIEILTEANLGVSDYFVLSTYKDASGKENKCYDCKKKGCEMLAHKFQGEKGIIFTARYINAFHEMEQKLREQQKPKKLDISDIPPWELGTSAPKYETIPERVWYPAEKPRIDYICKEMQISRKTLFHRILVELSNWIDIKDRRELYKATYGQYPAYNLDILDAYLELENIVDDYLTFIEKSLVNYRQR